MVAETPTVEQIADIVGLALVQFSETRRLRKMVPNPDEREPLEPKRSVPDFQRALSDLSNSELLSALDLTLLELERRLYRYAHEGEEIMEIADEGMLLASRARARLEQALSAAQHTQGHLQVVGVGEWNPTRTNPSWNGSQASVQMYNGAARLGGGLKAVPSTCSTNQYWYVGDLTKSGTSYTWTNKNLCTNTEP
jgi:hypothetical protein